MMRGFENKIRINEENLETTIDKWRPSGTRRYS